MSETNRVECQVCGAMQATPDEVAEAYRMDGSPELRAELPETIAYDHHPYTYGATLGDLRWEGEHNGRPLLRARVLEGREASYLFGRSASKDIAGRVVVLYGVRKEELDAGRIIRVA